MRLDQGPWSFEKLRRKLAKHLLWAVFALWTGFTFVGFFTPVTELWQRGMALDWGGWETFWVLFYGLATWGNAGFLREQVCKYMCPYARFQSAMFDRNTLIIAYDALRGEPRGARRRGTLDSVLQRARGLLDKVTAYDYVFRASQHPSAAASQAQARGTITFETHRVAEPLPDFTPEQLGDCIDCTLCVQVCPTGIDIRNGLQYECIACGACIDACDQVMDKVGYPRGLIRYTTQNAIDGRTSRILRPRILVYATLLLVLVAAWGWGVTHRHAFLVEALRDRNALYRKSADGSLQNSYQIKIANKAEGMRWFRITLGSATPDLALQGGARNVRAAPGEVLSVPVTVTAPEGVRGRIDLEFVVTEVERGEARTADSRFFGPL
jgi:polyferredoxin